MAQAITRRRSKAVSKRTTGDDGRVTITGKARNGAGSVYLDKSSNRWVGRCVTGKDENGKPIRKTVYGKSADEATAKLIELQSNAQQGTVTTVKGRVPTLREYAEAWLASRVGLRNERSLVRLRYFLAPALAELGHVQISKLEPGDVNRLTSGMLRAGKSPGGVTGTRAALRACLNAAIKEGKIPSRRNAASDSEPIKARREEMHPLSTDQVKVLLRAATSPPEALGAWEAHEGPLFGFLATTGLRVSEALGLCWHDYVPERGTIKVRLQLKRGKGRGFALEALKTEKSARVVHLSPPARAMLEHVRERQERERAGSCWGNEWGLGLIFADKCGKPIDQTSIAKRWYLWRAALGFDSVRVRVHDLRHTFATHALAAGMPVTEVSRALGHARVSITLDVYSHSTDEGQKRLAETLGRLYSD